MTEGILICMHLLRAYIEALVAEAIARPQPEPKRLSDLYKGTPNAPMMRPQFKLNEFKKLQTLDEMLTYAHKNLEKLGFGSSRSVFRLTGTRVLKMANSMTKGTAQNKAELDVFTNPVTAPIITKIYDYDPKYRWLVSEVVKPFSHQNQDEFQALTGIPWESFKELIQDRRIPSDWDLDEQQIALVKGTFSLMTDNQLVLGDLNVIDHWGKTADGRVVVLDYGFTENVALSYDNKRPWSRDETDDRPDYMPPTPEQMSATTQPSPGAPPAVKPQHISSMHSSEMDDEDPFWDEEWEEEVEKAANFNPSLKRLPSDMRNLAKQLRIR